MFKFIYTDFSLVLQDIRCGEQLQYLVYYVEGVGYS